MRGHPWWMRLSFSGVSVNPYHVIPTYEDPPYCWEELSVSGSVPDVVEMEVPWMTSFYYSWTDHGTPGGYGTNQYQEFYKVFSGPSCTRNGAYSSDQWRATFRFSIYDWTQFGMYGGSGYHNITYSKTATLTNYAIGAVCVATISQVFHEWPLPADPMPASNDPEWGLNPDGSGPQYETRTVNNAMTSGDSGDPCYPNSGYGGFAIWKPCKADFQTRPNEMGW